MSILSDSWSTTFTKYIAYFSGYVDGVVDVNQKPIDWKKVGCKSSTTAALLRSAPQARFEFGEQRHARAVDGCGGALRETIQSNDDPAAATSDVRATNAIQLQ